MEELIRIVQSVGAPTLYLVAVVMLFKLYRDSNDSSRKEIIDLLNRYHAGMMEQTKAYEDLAERL